MPWAIGGAILGGALISGYGAKKAGKESAKGARYAADLEQKRFEQSRADMLPWLQSGKQALRSRDELMGMTGEERGEKLRSMPGYQFRLEEGLRSIRRGALAGSKTGGTYRGLMEYGQEYASSEFDREFNRLQAMAGGGQVASGQLGQLGAQSAARQGAYAQSAADARASGYLGMAGAASGGLGMAAGMYGGGGGGMPSYYGGGRVAPGGSFGGGNLGAEGYSPYGYEY